MHDLNLEERLRSVLRTEGDSQSLTITTDELERRLALRRRARNGQRLSLIAAGIAVLAVGTMVALSNGWLRTTNVATPQSPSPAPSASASAAPSPSPDAVVSPSPAASSDPLAALPVLVKDPLSLDVYMTESPGDPSSDITDLINWNFDGVRMEAREAGIEIVCLGDDARFEWGVDGRDIASEPVACDGTVQSFRFDVSAFQPLFRDAMFLYATPRTAFRILINTFGSLNDPRPTALPSFATPPGPVLADVARTEGVPGDGAHVAMQAGTVPPRGGYLVAMVCLGQGTARWSIGDVGERDFVAAGEVDCDGAAIGFDSSEGVPLGETQVWVTTDPANTWHIIVTDPFDGDAPAWIAPQLVMWAGSDMEGAGAAGLSRCTSHGEGGDSCAGPWSARDGAAQVIVPSHSEVTIRIQDGWRINQARITARERDKVRLDAFGSDPEIDVAYFEDGSDSVTLLLTGLKNGEWIVRVALNATKGSDSFGGHYDIPVIVGG